MQLGLLFLGRGSKLAFSMEAYCLGPLALITSDNCEVLCFLSLWSLRTEITCTVFLQVLLYLGMVAGQAEAGQPLLEGL